MTVGRPARDAKQEHWFAPPSDTPYEGAADRRPILPASPEDEPVLTGFWYLAIEGSKLRPGRTAPATILGEPLLLGRTAGGAAFAYVDRCPHRHMPMRHGGFDGTTLRCPYHGWGFRASDGICTDIPALAEPDEPGPGRFRLRHIPCREVQGNVWVFMAAAGAPVDDAALPEVPTIAGFDGQVPQVSAVMRFPCNVDTAVFGFIDPAHPAFVHTSRWWKTKPAALRLKEKHFEPDALGFRMKEHALKHGANPYRLLGRNVRVNLRILLPGLRIEQVSGERHRAAVLAAATPVDADTTDVHYCVYWTIPWLAPLKPFARMMTRDFLGQDRVVAERLHDAGATGPPKMFVGDADAQIRWWLRLTREHEASTREARPFVNPLRAQVLRWRS